MQFPSRDLTLQYISTSYQDVVQRYTATGSLTYLLDGLGYVICGIPTSSVGQTILTQDQTASYSLFAVTASYTATSSITNITSSLISVTSASWASSSLSSSYSNSSSYSSNVLSSSYAEYSDNSGLSISSSYANIASLSLVSDVALLADTASFADTADNATSASYTPYSDTSISASWASSSISSSYALTASYAANAGGGGGTILYTGSTYQITSSFAVSASWAPSSGGSSLSSSWASSSISSSYSVNADTSSISISASYSVTASWTPFVATISASWASQSLSASYLIGSSVSSSWASQSLSSSWSPVPTSASWSSASISASYADSTPFNPNVQTLDSRTGTLYFPMVQYAQYNIVDQLLYTDGQEGLSWDIDTQTLNALNIIGTINNALSSTSSSYAVNSDTSSLSLNSLTAFSASWASASISSSYALTSSWSPVPVSSSWSSASISASFAPAVYQSSGSWASSSLSASYLINVPTTNLIISSDSSSFISATTNAISASTSGVPIFTFVTQSNITSQNGTGSFSFNGRITSSNINIGVPNDSYPWGSSLNGSYFSSWNSDTNVSDILRFFAGAFSSSYPTPSPNTKIFSSVTATNNLGGSTVTINGIVPNSSSNANINYLQLQGWASVGSIIFNGYTFKNGTGYMSYGSNVGGATTHSSSLGVNAFGLGTLTNGNITQINLSGSFQLTFAPNTNGFVAYTATSGYLLSQITQNLVTSIATPIAVNSIPSANTSVIPSVYEDGYFNNFTGSNLTNSILLSSLSSSGIYVFSSSVGINSGSSPYTFYTPTPTTYYYTPLTDGTFVQSITSPGSAITASIATSRSLSGVPYLTTGSTYRYNVTASGAFNPLYLNGTVSSVSIPGNTLTLTTSNPTTLTTNPTIQTIGVVKSASYAVTRSVGTYPYESDVIVFDVTMNATGTGTTTAASGSSLTSFTVSNTTYNRANSGTGLGSQTTSIHTPGSFGQPVSSGSLLYYGRPDGYVASTLNFSTVANTETFLDEANRIVLNNNLLSFTGNAFNSLSILGLSELQIKPGFVVNPSANAAGHTGYWYPPSYGTNYKYYVRHFKTTAVVNVLQLVIAGNTTLVNWNSIASNSMAIALLFESADTNVYANCRLYDISNLTQNLIQAGVTPTDSNTAGTNPFGSNIDLYGNNGSGASNVGGTILFPMRTADGAVLDSTNTSADEVYLIVRYNGTPTTPLSSIAISKSS